MFQKIIYYLPKDHQLLLGTVQFYRVFVIATVFGHAHFINKRCLSYNVILPTAYFFTHNSSHLTPITKNPLTLNFLTHNSESSPKTQVKELKSKKVNKYDFQYYINN